MKQTEIFRNENLDYEESPEQLDAYMKTSGVSIWIVLLALVILMITAVIWGITGTLPETIEVKGYTDLDGVIRCYVPSDTEYLSLEGCRVNCVLTDGSAVQGTVKSVSKQPYSREELKERLDSDWIAENIISDVYSYELIIDAKEQYGESVLISAVITVDEVKPITFLLN